MQGTSVLFGQILAVFSIVIAGVWGATQWTAAALGYQLRLGSPWFDLFGTPVYHPWRLFEWWFVFDAYAPQVFDTGGAIAGASGMVAVVVAIGMSIWRSRQSRLVTTYGSARWADAAEVRKAGLTQPAGVFLGLHDGQYLRHEGPEHGLAFAPTRSGKGVGLVVPTLLSWPGSAVIHDIKGENWNLTAGWRSRFSHCLLFNPTDAKSAAYNPLLEVRRSAHEVRDVQNIADILVDPEGALEKRNHWEKTSHALLVGAILHVLYAVEDKTLRGVANFLSDPACPFEVTLHRMMTTRHLGDTPHPVVASAAREVLNKSENERSGGDPQRDARKPELQPNADGGGQRAVGNRHGARRAAEQDGFSERPVQRNFKAAREACGVGIAAVHAITAPPENEKKDRKKLEAANAIVRPKTIWISLRKPPLVSPNANASPVAMMTMTAMIRATGPWIDSRMDSSGPSQGMLEPAACAADISSKRAASTAACAARCNRFCALAEMWF